MAFPGDSSYQCYYQNIFSSGNKLASTGTWELGNKVSPMAISRLSGQFFHPNCAHTGGFEGQEGNTSQCPCPLDENEVAAITFPVGYRFQCYYQNSF